MDQSESIYRHPTDDSIVLRTKPDRILHERRKLDRMLRWIRTCAGCRSCLPPIDRLCESCWRHLERLRNRGDWLRQEGYPFPVYSLLTWTDQNDAFVRPFIYSLKGGYAVAAYEKLINLLVFERRWQRENERPVFVHPPPSGSRADHSRLLALMMAEYWQAALTELEWDSSSKIAGQKQLTAGERTRRRFLPALGEAVFSPATVTRVFVDDVITTGATAMAAYMALGNPERFEAWALICRPKLATSERF